MKIPYAGKISILFGLTWGLAGLDRLMVGYMAGGYMPELGLSYTQLGLIITISGLGVACGSWIIGPLTEFYGRRTGSVWVNLVQTVLSGLTGLVQSFGQMLGIRFLMNFGFGGMYGPGFAAISEESPPESRGFWMGLAQSFWPLIGMGIGPIIAGYLFVTVGWRYGFFIVAIPGIILCIALSKFMREPQSVKENINSRKETGRKVLLHKGEELKLKDVLKYRNVIIMCIVAVCAMAYLYVLFTFVPSFFGDVHGFSPVQTGWVMSGGGFLCFALQVLAPYLSDKMGRKPLLLYLFCLGTIGGVLFALSPVGTSPALLAFYFALFCTGLSSFPLYLVIVPTESVPFTLAATAVAVPQGLGELVGCAVFPAIGGWIADVYGLTSTMWLVVACSALAFLVCFFMKETAPKVLEKKGEIPASM